MAVVGVAKADTPADVWSVSATMFDPYAHPSNPLPGWWFPTVRKATADIRSATVDGPHLVKTGETWSGGTRTVSYAIPPQDIGTWEPWVYSVPSSTSCNFLPSATAIVDCMLEGRNPCGQSTMTQTSGWQLVANASDESYQLETSNWDVTVVNPTYNGSQYVCGPTTSTPSSVPARRTREKDCPAGPPWHGRRASASDGYCYNGLTASTNQPKVLFAPQPVADGHRVCVGNPCDTSNGNKIESVLDYRGPGLEFVRTYHSNVQLLATAGLGENWTHNYAARIVFQSSATPTTPMARQRQDGQPELLVYSSSTRYIGERSGEQLIKVGSEWELNVADGGKQRYSASGRLLWLENALGHRTTLTYGTNGLLEAATGPFGHTLEFTYDGGTLIAMTDPASQTTEYHYDGNNLEQVDYPDSTQRFYHYENASVPWGLTGVTDENGDRYSTFAYNTDGLVISTEHAGGYGKYTLAYNADASTTVTDAVGNVKQFQFGSITGSTGGRQPTAFTQGGVSATRTYTTGYAGHRVASSTNEGGVPTTFGYDSTYRLTSKTDASGTASARLTSYQYLNADRLLITEEHSPSVNGGLRKVITGYDASQRPGSITVQGFTPTGTPVSRAIVLTYNSAGQVATINGPRTDVTDVTTLTYHICTSGGACGQLQSVTNALGHVTTYNSYDAHGRVTQLTDPNSVVTVFAYDLRGRVTSITETPPGGSARETVFEYDPAGLLETVTAPNGTVLTYEHDAAHQLLSITDNLGNKIEYGYNLNGDRTSEDVRDSTGTLRRVLDFTYDARRRLDTINAAGSVTDLLFDATGRLTDETDPNSNATEHIHDALHRVTETIDALAGSTKLGYDSQDRLTGVRAPNGATTYFRYDDLDNLRSLQSPDTGVTTYGYDAAGNRTSALDANGVSVTYAYDALNRLTGIDYPGSSLDVGFAYDQGTGQLGRLTSITDGSGSTTFGYDRFGNLTQESKTIGGNTHVTGYAFDAADLLTQITYPSGRTVDYTRNVLGQVTTVATSYGGTNGSVASSASYEPFGPLKGLTFGNGLTLTRIFDQQYRLTDQTTGAIQDLGFAHDAAGNIDGISDGVNVGLGQGFEQDALHRITSEAGSYGTKGYTYDGSGNRLTRTHGAVTQALTYATVSPPPGGGGGGGATGSPGTGGATLAVSATAVLPSGSVTATLTSGLGGGSDWLALAAVGAPVTSYLQWRYVGSGVTTLNWTVTMPSTPGAYEFRLFLNNGYTLAATSPAVSVSSTPAGSVPWANGSNRMATHDGQTIGLDANGNTLANPAENVSFTYGAHHRQLEAYVGAALKATFVYNGQGQRIKKIEASGAQRTIVYHYGQGGELFGETIYSSAGAKIGERDYLWLDTLPLAQSERAFSGGSITGSSFVYVHADQLNTPRLATNASGTVVWRWDSDAFGLGAANQDPDSDTNLVNIRLRFPGQYLDEETGLHYNYFRDYDAVTGRYVQSDPIGLGGGLNTYAYAGGNPNAYFDRDGLKVLNPNNFPVSDAVWEALEEFNGLIGCNKDVIITGGNRLATSRLGAGSNSTHVQGIAADIRVPGQSHLVTANHALKSGLFGGVGWYEEGYRGPNGEGPHTHVDLRSRAKNAPPAEWGINAKGGESRIPRVAVTFAHNCECPP